MNVFYETLPEFIVVDNEEYAVITDFREWIRFSDMLKADIPADVKIIFLSEMFLECVPNIYTPDGFEKTIDSITQFLTMDVLAFPSDGDISDSDVRRSIYYDYDAPYIISAFLREYRIDLLTVEYMHWWMFKMLLDGLDEKSQIKERIYYRTVDIRNIKDKDEKKRILQIRRRITVEDDEYVSDVEIGNAFI